MHHSTVTATGQMNGLRLASSLILSFMCASCKLGTLRIVVVVVVNCTKERTCSPLQLQSVCVDVCVCELCVLSTDTDLFFAGENRSVRL